jgi:hypothetical protein
VPNPQGVTAGQNTCNIAAYLTNLVIKAAINQAVTSITAEQSLVETGMLIIGVIPGLDLFGLAIDAAGGLYLAVQAGTLSDYTDATADAALWSDIQCAIYQSILADGQVTDNNFAAMVTAVRTVSYAHAGVVTTIADYIEHMGATAVESAQLAGGLYVGDCTACGTWCYTWDLTATPGPFTTFDYVGADVSGYGTWVEGVGWAGQNWASLREALHLRLSFTAQPDGVDVDMTYAVWPSSDARLREFDTYLAGTSVHTYDFNGSRPNPPTTNTQHSIMEGPIDRLEIYLDTDGNTATAAVISALTISGNGRNPFGVSNC